MKQNPSFTLKELAGVPYLLPFGQMIADQRRGLKTNDTGVYLWNLLKKEHSLKEVLSLSAAYYQISKENLPEFRDDITRFTNQLLHLGILVDSANDSADSSLVSGKIQASRNFAASASKHPTDDLPETKHILSIGNLNLSLLTPPDAFPPDFSDFVVTDSTDHPLKIHQNICLHSGLPVQPVCGKVLLHNLELVIIEQEEQYLLHFPTAKTHLEIHLSKDGQTARCYSLPPYDDAFRYAFFHAIRLIYLYLAQKHNMAALHSASILYRDKLWLFSGHSGMGKSTHTNMWKEHFDTPVINGDLNLLAIENGHPMVHGIPWCGTSQIYDTKTYPLGGIILLDRSETDFVEELSADKKHLLISQRLISPSWTKELWLQNMNLTETIADAVLVCKLQCTKKLSAVETIKQEIDRYQRQL